MKYISSRTALVHALLHVAQCIRKQGSAGKDWCFAIERYGRWVKRWAQSNRKQVITAMNNRIIKEERVSVRWDGQESLLTTEEMR
jgi:hypothetical protein